MLTVSPLITCLFFTNQQTQQNITYHIPSSNYQPAFPHVSAVVYATASPSSPSLDAHMEYSLLSVCSQGYAIINYGRDVTKCRQSWHLECDHKHWNSTLPLTGHLLAVCSFCSSLWNSTCNISDICCKQLHWHITAVILFIYIMIRYYLYPQIESCNFPQCWQLTGTLKLPKAQWSHGLSQLFQEQVWVVSWPSHSFLILSHWLRGHWLSCPRHRSLEQRSDSGGACRHRTTLVNVNRHARQLQEAHWRSFHCENVRNMLENISSFALLMFTYFNLHFGKSRKDRLSFDTKHAPLLQNHISAMAVSNSVHIESFAWQIFCCFIPDFQDQYLIHAG